MTKAPKPVPDVIPSTHRTVPVPFDSTVNLKMELLVARIVRGGDCMTSHLMHENILEAVKVGILEVDTQGFLRGDW